MNFTYGDTTNIKDISTELINIANEYNIEITNLFKRLLNIPTESKEWVGNKADEYVKIVSLDKQQYIDFYNSLKEFANKLSETADNIENCVKITQAEGDYN